MGPKPCRGRNHVQRAGTILVQFHQLLELMGAFKQKMTVLPPTGGRGERAKTTNEGITATGDQIGIGTCQQTDLRNSCACELSIPHEG